MNSDLIVNMRKKAVQWLFILAVFTVGFVLAPPQAGAQGGPPMITDDPDTPGTGYWEINLSMLLHKARSERRLEAPFADINYGVGKRIQLKFEIPWVSARETGKPAESVPGNSAFGVKWRFIGEEGRTVAWSVYPQLEVNTGGWAVDKGIEERSRKLFLPTELTLEFGHVEINTEVGRNFVQHGPDNWAYGFSTEAELNRRFELLGEVHGEQIPLAPSEIILNVGGRQRLTSQMILLMAVGRAVHGPQDERHNFRLYLGLQFNLPGQNVFDHSKVRP